MQVYRQMLGDRVSFWRRRRSTAMQIGIELCREIMQGPSMMALRCRITFKNRAALRLLWFVVECMKASRLGFKELRVSRSFLHPFMLLGPVWSRHFIASLNILHISGMYMETWMAGSAVMHN